MPSKKRARSDAEEARAECPFSVRQRAPTAQELSRQSQSGGKTKRDNPEEDRRTEWHWQHNLFAPAGFTKPAESLDLKYIVDPAPAWGDLTRYNSFVLGKEKFHAEDYVFVANEESLKRQKTTEEGVNGALARRERDGNEWVARILEIRASDEQHVYARVCWMYWPDEIPPGTQLGRKTIRGRQSYHGKHELIASNHMDVINAVSVTGFAEVHHWLETDEEENQPALYWRQGYNCNTGQISAAKDICKCQTPAHPDKMLIRCSDTQCGRWMHDDCLRHDVLMRVFTRLGRSEPQTFEEKDHKEPTEIKKEGEESLASPPATDSEKRDGEQKPLLNNGTKPLPLYVEENPSLAPSSAKKGAKKEPYRDLFDAKLRLDDGPTVWCIEDLRNNVEGGCKAWLERAYCLFCSKTID